MPHAVMTQPAITTLTASIGSFKHTITIFQSYIGNSQGSESTSYVTIEISTIATSSYLSGPYRNPLYTIIPSSFNYKPLAGHVNLSIFYSRLSCLYSDSSSYPIYSDPLAIYNDTIGFSRKI